MDAKPLKVTFSVQADRVEEAIAFLADRFLRCSKSGCKVVRQRSEFSLLPLCQPLIDDWKHGKVRFDRGDITLVFSRGELEATPNLLIYNPEQGERFLYGRSAYGDRCDPQQIPLQDDSSGSASGSFIVESLHTINEAIEQLTAHQRSVESRLQELLTTNSSVRQSETSAELETAIQKLLEAQTAAFTKQLQTALENQAANFAQTLANQITATALHFSQRLDALQTQFDELMAQVKAIPSELRGALIASLDAPDPIPRTEEEWLHRIQSTWGTVGDYEQYTLSHRVMNAETPIYHTPDWVALCELDWAQKLHPALAVLYDVLYGKDSIGEGGADILQQFGKHFDLQTGAAYYVYHQGGFSAYDALLETVNNPRYSWLSDLTQLYEKVAQRHPIIFELFGWETDAIAALKTIVQQAAYGTQSDWRSSERSTQEITISDYLAVLNIGPFTPITPEAIKRAYRQAMKLAHPDAGGNKEWAQQINEAYEAVLKHYFPTER